MRAVVDLLQVLRHLRGLVVRVICVIDAGLVVEADRTTRAFPCDRRPSRPPRTRAIAPETSGQVACVGADRRTYGAVVASAALEEEAAAPVVRQPHFPADRKRRVVGADTGIGLSLHDAMAGQERTGRDSRRADRSSRHVLRRRDRGIRERRPVRHDGRATRAEVGWVLDRARSVIAAVVACRERHGKDDGRAEGEAPGR